MVRSALKSGKIIRPTICSICHRDPGAAIDGRSLLHAHHHKGYDRPLDIIWLCSGCHAHEDPRARGTRSSQSKLTDDAIRAIRLSDLPTITLAQKYGVHPTTVQRARRGVNWSHVDIAPNIPCEMRNSIRTQWPRTQSRPPTRLRRDSTTGYQGVRFDRQRNSYFSVIKVKGKRIYLGYFRDPKDASAAYEKARSQYYGDFAAAAEDQS